MDSDILLYELDGEPPGLLGALEERYHCETEPPARRRIFYLDSFDWRLFHEGLVLTFESSESRASGAELCLSALDGSPRQMVRVRRRPLFACELPRSALRTRLEGIVVDRRLLVMSELDLLGVEARILDSEKKTVARIFSAHGTASAPEGVRHVPMPPSIELRAVKGYRRVFRDLEDYLDALPQAGRRRESLFEFALEAVGRAAGDYSPVVAVQLDPAMPVEEATSVILHSQLAIVEANREGVQRDWDPEFLHDLRVATRRTRSLLRQFKEVLPRSGFKRLRKDLRWIGRVTGTKRDIDVYLGTLATYDRIFSPEIAKGLQPLRDYLTGRQREEQTLLARELDSARYRRLISSWREAGLSGGRSASDVPIAKIAAARIISGHRKVLDLGAQIGDRLDPVQMHRLRIACKELRYLLEFFRTLFGPKVLNRVIKEMRGLQDVLGEINDLQVQQENLQRYAKAMVSENIRRANTLLNMGRLLGHFETSQVKLFPKFQASFRSFGRRSVQQTLTDGLFHYLEDPS